MTQVFFYHGASDKIAAACALLGGAYAKRKPMLVFAPDKAIANSVDRMLWTQPALGFVPHCQADSPVAAETPIVITDSLDSIPQDERLMNLSQVVPPGFSRFQSLIEVVGQEEDERSAARDRVKFYKDRGYEVRYFDLSAR
ncbi:DNA polymerase III subunit chi [Dechloromonas denitrificans]|uniref:DNA polymerase III subunit chi n=1 Tax=Dechloromonas denitrificans TaxID=281362 RepID=UPI001CF898C6|nr:DNA polymerase III subunit chi [Dechloromonas denitrificans]UCV02530.1 DNA polymerase III subunit chi [Dechloromonas denitrificans]UCV06828.1 DNA polymerase III subunit chi [Dechloromonas denitrificans]